MSRIVYEPPWVCYRHNYFTQKKAEFFQHLHDVPHENIVNDNCEKCGVPIKNGRVNFEGLNEPVIPLCEVCKTIPNVKEYIRAKRRQQFPNLIDTSNVPENFSSRGISE